MRKHSARKWLHAILDLLPVLILPIFAIYEINHNDNQPISVEITENIAVDFNQLISTNNSYQIGNATGSNYYNIANLDEYLQNNHVYHIRWYQDNSMTSDTRSTPVLYNGITQYYFNGSVNSYLSNGYYFYQITVPLGNQLRLDYWYHTTVSVGDVYVSDFQVFDLTQMFGAGNEPTITEFNDLFNEPYYDFDIGTEMLLTGVSTQTLNNTDIGSQMLYALYKPIKEYFNFDNVFNFGKIYHWFELNMFGGNAPMPIYIVWNIIVYQFLMDLIFLVYSVFMFIIDFATDTLERFTGWGRKGD